jgi:predicted DNA-binding ribbon-helix-helix protein
MMLKMKALIKAERAFWETSSEITREKERGVAVLLAEA